MSNPILSLANVVGAIEPLARYLTQSNHYHLQTHSVRPKAFDPPPDLRLSVFRIEGLTIEEIWENGIVNVINMSQQPRNLNGAAKITVSAVREIHLEIEADDKPQRHAAIVGWPQDKSERILLGQKLAAKATLIMRS